MCYNGVGIVYRAWVWESDQHGFKSQFFHFLALQLLTSKCISLGLSVLSSEMGPIITMTAQSCESV
mgnify:CR=1 FL=1